MSALIASDVAVTLGTKAVLQGVTLSFAPGQVTAIIGPNGAGKSTLLTCLVGLRRPDRGTVSVDGKPLAAILARERGQTIAYLPQTPEVAWPVTVRTLVGLGRIPFTGARGLTDVDLAAVDRALRVTETEALAERIVETLSGGERARVLLARALAGEPRWLLADEPLHGLDPRHQLDASDLFRRMAHEDGRGVIVTLHDLHVAARVADRIVVLADGQVLCDGPPVEALASEVLERAYGVRARTVQGQGGPLIEILGRHD